MKTINYNNFKYTLKPCVLEDIDSHFELVKHLLFYDYDFEYASYKTNMKTAIKYGYAYQVLKEDKIVSFLYLTKHYNLAIGNSIYSKDIFALYLLIKEFIAKHKVSKISYYPHRKIIFKKLISKESMTKYYFYNTPLIFPIKTLISLIEKLSIKFTV